MTTGVEWVSFPGATSSFQFTTGRKSENTPKKVQINPIPISISSSPHTTSGNYWKRGDDGRVAGTSPTLYVGAELVDEGQWHFLQKEYDASMRLFLDALEAQRAEFPDTHPCVAHTLGNIGSVLLKRGELEHALQTLHEASRLHHNMPDGIRQRTEPIVADLNQNMGNIHYLRGSYDESLDCYKIALRARRNDVERNPIGFADTLHNIGQVLLAKREPDKAMAAFREALRITRISGEGKEPKEPAGREYNSKLIETMEKIGWLYLEKGKHDQAMSSFVEILRLTKMTMGQDHMDVAPSLYNIGVIHEIRGELDDAWEVYTMALDAYQRCGLEDDDPNIVTIQQRVHNVKQLLGADAESI